MLWSAAEAAIRAHVETQWAQSAYADTMPLVWENESEPASARYMALTIDGVYADKGIYGSSGKRLSVEGGIVFFHAFVPTGTGKAAASGPIDAMTAILELQTISGAIDLEGGNPPSPVSDDPLRQTAQPGGNYYRCSGSVAFIIRGAR